MNGSQYKVTIVGEGGDVFEFIGREIKKTEEQLNSFAAATKKLGEGFFFFNQISQGLQQINNEFQNAIKPGLTLQTSMKELEAVTGATGEALIQIEKDGREMAKTFGGDAAASIEGAKLLLSQLTPEIAKNPPALKEMERNAALLSKQLKNDIPAATEIATTAMNAYGVSMDDPMEAAREMRRMMDEMTTGAQIGSAELPQIKEALENIGSSAKNANVSFAETNAAIQVLDKNALKGAQGGTAYRNVLAKLGEGRFMSKESLDALTAAGVNVNVLTNKSLSLAQRLDELKKIQGDTALVSQFFGRENANAGFALLNNTDLLREYTTAIENGEGATEKFANTVMSSTEEKISRMKATITDWGISLQQATEPIQPFMSIAGGALQTIATLGMAVSSFSILADTQFVKSMGKMATATWGWIAAQGAAAAGLAATGAEMAIIAFGEIGTYIAGLVTATAAQWGFNVAMYANPIGLLVLGIVATIGAIAALVIWWDEITAAVWKFVEFMYSISPFGVIIETVENIFPGTKKKVMDFFDSIWQWIKGFWDKLKGVWDDIKSWFGFGSDNQATLNVDVQKQGPYGDIQVPGSNPTDKNTSLNTKSNNNITDGLNSVSGGTAKGESVKNMNITIQRIVGIENLHVTHLTEGVRKAGDMVLEGLVSSVRDGEIALSGN